MHLVTVREGADVERHQHAFFALLRVLARAVVNGCPGLEVDRQRVSATWNLVFNRFALAAVGVDAEANAAEFTGREPGQTDHGAVVAQGDRGAVPAVAEAVKLVQGVAAYREAKICSVSRVVLKLIGEVVERKDYNPKFIGNVEINLIGPKSGFKYEQCFDTVALRFGGLPKKKGGKCQYQRKSSHRFLRFGWMWMVVFPPCIGRTKQ